MKEIEKKYELIPSDREGLYRVKALKDFNNVKKGDIGGYVETENNLSQFGDCWVYDEAVVRDNARVYGSAQVRGEAQVCSNVEVYDNAVVRDNAILRKNARVWGNVVIQGDTQVWTNAIVIENVVFMGEVDICGDAIISSNKDFIIFKNNWSSGRYFIWTRSNNMWKVGCFYGTGEELIAKAYEDSEEKGREYEKIVKYVESILNTEECKTNNQNSMKKKIQKPFDLEKVKKGARVETRDGKSVRIVCYDRISSYPILALIFDGKAEICYTYKLDGSLGLDAGTNSADLVIIEEVEVSKFNVGDWVFATNCKGYPLLITAITSYCYELQDNDNKIEMYQTIVDAFYRLWTLKDAKPGDVLISEDDKRPFIFKESFGGVPTAYCGIDTTGSIYIGTDGPWTRTTVRPATSNEKDILFKKMEEEGYKWDAESLTVSKIQWRDNEYKTISGYYTHTDSCIIYSEDHSNTKENYNLFATEKQVKSALAMARISQIMANDERFGGVVTDKEWKDKNIIKFVIRRMYDDIICDSVTFCYNFLAFHTEKQAKLFLEENEDLVKDYYMMY